MTAVIQRFHFQGLIRVYSCPFAVSRIRVSHRGNSSSPGLISHASVELHSPGCTLLTSAIAIDDIKLKSAGTPYRSSPAFVSFVSHFAASNSPIKRVRSM